MTRESGGTAPCPQEPPGLHVVTSPQPSVARLYLAALADDHGAAAAAAAAAAAPAPAQEFWN